jgi:hypothetical protein
LVCILYFGLKKFRYRKGNWVEYRVKKGEQIFDIADAIGMHWKKLARANKCHLR